MILKRQPANWQRGESRRGVLLTGSSVRSVTDPFLLSGYGGESVPAARSAGGNGELALRSGLPWAILDIVPAEAVESFVTRVESWAELAADLRQELEAAGFHQHDPSSAGGGFHIAAHLRDDGVLVSWATRRYASCEPGSFESTVENIMRPALQAILAARGFAAQAIPEGHDDAGYILVTARTDTPELSREPARRTGKRGRRNRFRMVCVPTPRSRAEKRTPRRDRRRRGSRLSPRRWRALGRATRRGAG